MHALKDYERSAWLHVRRIRGCSPGGPRFTARGGETEGERGRERARGDMDAGERGIAGDASGGYGVCGHFYSFLHLLT